MRMAFLHDLQKAAATSENDLKYLFKTFFTTIPWIGNIRIAFNCQRIKASQHADVRAVKTMSGCEGFGFLVVVSVHGENQRGRMEIVRMQLPSAVLDLQLIFPGIPQGTGIGLFTDMMAGSSA